MQWNVLADGLTDCFFKVPREALVWSYRLDRILREIERVNPSILCLQELNHFDLLKEHLHPLGFEFSVYFPKPASPAALLGFPGDGTAVFVKSREFDQIDSKQVEQVSFRESDGSCMNQGYVQLRLKPKLVSIPIVLIATHLKAKAEATETRIRQVDQILKALEGQEHAIVCGDFNDFPSSPPIQRMLKSGFRSVYTQVLEIESHYTTWKIRKEGEKKGTIDYIFVRSSALEAHRVFLVPEDSIVPECRYPSLEYPSDHISMAADIIAP